MRAGAPVILGTDSRASNPDLSIWKDLQLATQQACLHAAPFPFEQLLKMVTTAPAEVLGMNISNFTVKEGQAFRIVVIADNSSATDDTLTWACRSDSLVLGVTVP